MDIEEDCEFCNPKNFAERIVGENRHFWVIVDVGQLSDKGHLLVIPKQHVPCIAALDDALFKEMIIVRSRAESALKIVSDLKETHSIPFPITLFEHGGVGQTVPHAHLHLLAEPINMTDHVGMSFRTTSKEIRRLNKDAHLQELYRKEEDPYLYWTAPSGSTYTCWSPSDVPLQYFRTIAAQMLGTQDRANWKDIQYSEENEQRWRHMVARLKPLLRDLK